MIGLVIAAVAVGAGLSAAARGRLASGALLVVGILLGGALLVALGSSPRR